MTPLAGLLLVDKPKGPTSHDIVEAVRRGAGGIRVGHTGTLDPLATGLLGLCLGRATRLSRFLTNQRKVYSGVLRLGITTDTYDSDGVVIRQADASGVTEQAIREAAARLVGPLMQAPPAYSARKVNGRPLHRLARAGKTVVLTPTPVTVH
ncbi:MAG TPA: pseudouridine synthase, partial [Candidatus Polarisedimenticolia bacterium]|nr:pseudouridine synthase [Candidatus Polarisedimenticolia bacterium]